MNHGLQFMESVIKVRSRIRMLEQNEKKTKSRSQNTTKTIVEIYKLKQANPKLRFKRDR